MHVFLFFALISYTFGETPNFDQKLEARIILNKAMFRSHTEGSKPALVQLEITIPQSIVKAFGLLNQGYQNPLRTNELQESHQIWHRDLRTVPQLVNYYKKVSRERFQYLIERYYKVLIKNGTHREITPEINATLSVYKLKFHKHINELLKENVQTQIEKDLILLDIIDLSSSLLYEGSLVCLQMMVDRHLSKQSTNMKTVSEEIFKKSLRKKRQDLKLLCNMTRICRPFPGFSEYLVDLLDEVIKLPDSKLHAVVMKTMVAVKNKQPAVEHLIGTKLAKKLGDHLQNVVYDELSEIRRMLTEEHRNILDRYKWKRLTNKDKAFRILLDIADKAFVANATDNIAEHISTIIKGIRNWYDIGDVLDTFINYVVKILTTYWGEDTCKEVRILVEIILDGIIPDKQHKYSYLLTNGSKYVNNLTV